jgi:4-diphosphocytidyl-2-C-methyl-D-erythritol kinase
VSSALAPAKINLALVVGPLRDDGKHEVATVLQAVDLADTVAVEPGPELQVTGFEDDTLVGDALRELASQARVEPRWHVTIEKRIPIAAGLGGGSSDAATALRLANDTLDEPLPARQLSELAARLGADVPFFLVSGSQLGTGDGTQLEPIGLQIEYAALLLLPEGVAKLSTGAVYDEFDRRDGAQGFETRRAELIATLRRVRTALDLANLPRNDLSSSPLAADMERLGAFRADVSGAGPAVYGLFENRGAAHAAAAALDGLGATRVCAPCRGTVGPR